jgi:hypothetical protein
MRIRVRATALFVAVLALPSFAWAQGRPVELGIDARVGFELSGSNTVSVGVPTQSFRAGFFVADAVSIEPRLSLNYIHSGESLVALAAELGPVFHFGSESGRSGPYLRPFGGINWLKVGSESDAQLTAGGGLGVKIPIAQRLATRLEATFTHAFESSELGGGNALGGTIGFSFFTH